MRGKSIPADVPVRAWLADDLSPEVRNVIRRLARAPDVRRVAVMPDVHLAHGVCIGCVVATEDLVYPQAVGGDIGCGMTAVCLDLDARWFRRRERCEAVLRRWRRSVPVMRHASTHDAPDYGDLEPAELSSSSLAACARRLARLELGTLGRGNHFLELQADDSDRLWILVHSGSRAIGQAILSEHLRRADAVGGGLVALDRRSESGAAYLADAAWATRYATLNRAKMLDAAIDGVRTAVRIAVREADRIDLHHNSVTTETHDGHRMLVHRKGANIAHEGMRGIVPGSMGTGTVHVVGRGLADALWSSSHGAGRVMSRTEARRRVTPSAVARQLGAVVVDVPPARLTDEAPAVYRDLDRVMRAQRDLVRVERRLRPIACFRGSRERGVRR